MSDDKLNQNHIDGNGVQDTNETHETPSGSSQNGNLI